MAPYFMVAVCTVVAILIMMGRGGLKRFLGYPNATDIFVTLSLTLLMHDTFSGMVVAAFASLFLSVTLWILRSSIGAERAALRWHRKYIVVPVPELYWYTVPAQECRPHWLAKVFSIGSKKEQLNA